MTSFSGVFNLTIAETKIRVLVGRNLFIWLQRSRGRLSLDWRKEMVRLSCFALSILRAFYYVQTSCKRIFLLLLVFTGYLLVAPPHLRAEDSVSPEAILSASEIGYPPFCIVDNHNLADGFAVELLRASLSEMGREVSFRTGPWGEVKQSLVDRKVQVLPLVGRTPEREEVFDFSFPYMTLHGTVVVRNGQNDIHSLADLQGKPVAVMAGDNAEEFVRRQNLDAGLVVKSWY